MRTNRKKDIFLFFGSHHLGRDIITKLIYVWHSGSGIYIRVQIGYVNLLFASLLLSWDVHAYGTYICHLISIERETVSWKCKRNRLVGRCVCCVLYVHGTHPPCRTAKVTANRTCLVFAYLSYINMAKYLELRIGCRLRLSARLYEADRRERSDRCAGWQKIKDKHHTIGRITEF